MRLTIPICIISFVLAGCASFKELEPKPDVLPLERGYIELKNDKENFVLEKDTKYFIKFPRPGQDHFSLVLRLSLKPALHTFFTSDFESGDGRYTIIPDEAMGNDSVCVYSLESNVPTFYWVIDTVRHDVELAMRYRYVPQWRYTFENKYTEYRDILSKNLVDRTTYKSIDANYTFSHFDFPNELEIVSDRAANIKAMKSELVRLENVFPKGIEATRDTAYENYQALRKSVDEELNFQDRYKTLLTFFQKEEGTKGNAAKFLEATPFFTEVLASREKYPPGAMEKADGVMAQRLSELHTYYDRKLEEKNDLEKITPQPTLGIVRGLYEAIGRTMPKEFQSQVKFVERFNTEATGVAAANDGIRDLNAYFQKHIPAPASGFYADLLGRVGTIRSHIPESEAAKNPEYGNHACATLLAQEITRLNQKANDMQAIYQGSADVASQVGVRAWGPAESRLKLLFNDKSVEGFNTIAAQKQLLVRKFESEIYNGVKLSSEQRVDVFVKNHEMDINNVAALYEDSSFVPTHELSFSSLGPNDLAQKRKQIQDYLDKMKYVQFPETAIKDVYREFSRNINDHGVERARAIVEHGKYYRGTDTQVKRLIEECNPALPKWIVKPKEYRRFFALPTTSNRNGSNEYMFRLRLQIPSEAQFPVFDINIKLPPDVAEKAGREQWYDDITINKKPIRNEGRFRITAPTSANEYECQISPVEMDKEGNNILEVRFKYPGFKVLELSGMAQVPIIRKN